MNESSIAGAHITGVYAQERILGELGKAILQRFEIDICLQRSELAERVDVYIAEIAVSGT